MMPQHFSCPDTLSKHYLEFSKIVQECEGQYISYLVFKYMHKAKRVIWDLRVNIYYTSEHRLC